MEEFELTEDDLYAVEIAENIAHLFLKKEQITPLQVVGLGNALYALQRLPLVTPGVHCEFGVVYQAGTEEFHEMQYIDFTISESRFKISKGWSVYDQAVGSDSYSEPEWVIESGGYRNTELEIFNLEENITEYLNLGAEILVNDESEIDYE